MRNKQFLIAHANGEIVEFRLKNNNAPWDSIIYAQSDVTDELVFSGDQYNFEFRIKPKKVLIRHGSSPYCEGGYPFVVVKHYSSETDSVSAAWENDESVTWLDNWHEASFGPEIKKD